MSNVCVCRKCGCRGSGDLWHGPACRCPNPEWVSLDKYIAEREAAERKRINEAEDARINTLLVKAQEEK